MALLCQLHTFGAHGHKLMQSDRSLNVKTQSLTYVLCAQVCTDTACTIGFTLAICSSSLVWVVRVLHHSPSSLSDVLSLYSTSVPVRSPCCAGTCSVFFPCMLRMRVQAECHCA
jgi:hypothetical protein